MNLWVLLTIGIIVGILLTTVRITGSDKDSVIKTLMRQAARWSTAAENDMNPMIAVLHANYGAAYLWAVNDIATTGEIEKAMGVDYQEFRDKIVQVQDTATRKAIMTCPEFGPPESILTAIGGEGV